MKTCRFLSSKTVTTALGNGVPGSANKNAMVRSLHMGTKGLRVGIQGAEMFLGQTKRGVELGPKAIRETGLVTALQNCTSLLLE